MTEHEKMGRDVADDGTGGDADLAALLRAVGARPQPPADATAAVRAAVAAEWRATVARQAPARRRIVQPWMALAASVAAVAIAVGVAVPRWNGTGDTVATVALVTGTAEIRHPQSTGWQPLSAGAQVAASDEIRTTSSGRIALHRADGLELRMDAATQVAFTGDARASLVGGQVYVDAGHGDSGSAVFVIGTPQGDVRHLGTQYSATLVDGDVQVAVREGSVAIQRAGTPLTARAGEALILLGDGTVTRTAVSSYGETWRWAEALAAGFAIEGRSLDEFLTWAARETGRKLVYASADAAREAQLTQLKGSIAGLAPEAAVAAVLAAEPGLQHRIAGGQIRVERADR
jgi:ferric-dicitrate binding protein FerR (iron transport regulator)